MTTTIEAEQQARDLLQRFGVRMCDENGETHGEELYCVGVDDIVDMIKIIAEKNSTPVKVSALEFVEMVYEKEHLVGKPIVWAEWPCKEQT